MFKIKKINGEYTIYRKDQEREAYIIGALLPGEKAPIFPTRKLARKWLKIYIGLLI